MTAIEPFTVPTGAAAWGVTAADIASYNAGREKEAEDMMAPIKAMAEKMGLVANTVLMPNASAAAAILDAADQVGCNLIVMASHGRRGVKRLILGSQAAEVVSSSKVPVLIIR